MSAGFLIKNKLRLKALNKMSKETANRSREKIALAMLDFMVSGSPKTSATAPIKHGFLRAAASVFVGNKLIAISPNLPTGGDNVKNPPKPNKSYNGKRGQITVGFNTPYATKQHEVKMNPGKRSADSGNSNPGNQWVTQHLKLDGQDLMKVAAKMYRKKF